MNFLKKLQEKYPIETIGLIISVSYIIYIEFIQQHTNEITFSIINNSNVFDINEPIKNLEIKYDSINLLELNEVLKLLTVKVENTGNTNITENMYYSKVPFGFKIHHGKIIQKPELLESNFKNSELQVSFIDSTNFINLPSVPFDKGDFYTVKVVCLAKNEKIAIEPQGKISGIKAFQISDATNRTSFDVPKWMKLISYITLTIIFLAVLYSLITGIITWFKNSKKRLLLKKFKHLNESISLPKEIEYLFMAYGIEDFKKLEEILTDSDKFKEILESDHAVMKELQKLRQYDPQLNELYDLEYCKGYIRYPLRKLISHASSIFNFPQNRFSEEPKNELKPIFVSDIKVFFEFLKHN